MDRKINSPDQSSDILLSPSGEKRVKVSHNGGIIIGNDSLDANNYKIHRGSRGLEIVAGTDATAEGVDSSNLAPLSASGVKVEGVDVTTIVVGSSSTSSDNLVLRRSGSGELELSTSDSTAPDGTPDMGKRTQLSQGSLVVGKSTTESENLRIYRSAPEELDVVSEDDATSDGTFSGTNKKNLNFRATTIGDDSVLDDNIKVYKNRDKELEFVSAGTPVDYGSPTPSGRAGRAGINIKSTVIGSNSTETENVKIRRSGTNTVEICRADDTTLDGSPSPTKSQISGESLHLGNETIGASLPNNVKLHRGADKQLEIVEGNDGTGDGILSNNKVQINVARALIGNDTWDNTDNVRLHRGSDGELEVIDGDSPVIDGTRSENKKQLNVNSISVGNSATHSENVKLHRGEINEIELVVGDSAIADGIRSTDKAQLNVNRLLVGNSATTSEDVRLHRGGPRVVEVIDGDSVVIDGTLAQDKKVQLNAREILLGNDTVSENANVKLHRGDDKVLEIVEGDDTTSDGTKSPNKADLNVGNISVGKLSGTLSNVGKNVKLHRGSDNTLQVVKGTDGAIDGTMSTELSKLSYKFEDISGISPVGQDSRPAWDSVTKKINYSDSTSWYELGANRDRNLLENVGFQVSMASNIMTIALKQADGATDPTPDRPAQVGFKSLAQTGSWTKGTASVGQTLEVPADATLGTIDNRFHRLYVYLVDAGGNLELGISQKYYDGTSLVETFEINSSSDDVGSIYTEIAHTSPSDEVPVKCLGFIETTQINAGYWIEAPSKVYVGDSGRRDSKDEVNSAVLNDVVAPGDVAVSNANGINSTEDIDGEEIVPNLKVSLTTTGRPVTMFLETGLAGTPSKLKLYRADALSRTARAWVYIYRYPQNSYPSMGVKIAAIELELTDNNYDTLKAQTIPASTVKALDTASAGNYVYGVSVATDATGAEGSALDVVNVRLVAYEL